jgi:hypothetical protein
MRVICFCVGWVSLCGGLAGCGSPGALPYAPAVAASPAVVTANAPETAPAAPLEALEVHVDGFHFENGDPDSQVEAHHYCTAIDADLSQCVIFDGSSRDARLLGVEYIVTRRAFEKLPADERRLWHSHAYDVTSGTLVAPELSPTHELAFMAEFVGTYGKTWQTWHDARQDKVPLGHPLLMAALTEDGQVDAGLLRARDDALPLTTSERRLARAYIEAPEPVDGADAWQRGEVLQLTLRQSFAKTEPGGMKAAPDRGEAEPSPTPTRRIRSHRVQQMYAALPRPDAD